MVFWIVAALLTLGSCLALLAPMARTGSSAVRDADHDLEVYRHQLDEIEREKAQGLIASREAEEARAEISRRILKADAQRTAEQSRSRFSRTARVAGIAAVLSVPLVSWGFYAAVGSPGLPAQPLQARLEADPEQGSLVELVARAESHLAANPDDARGWDVLGPVYLRMGRSVDAANAFRRAITIDGPTALRQTGLGEALAAQAGGLVTLDAQAAFQRALDIDPSYPRARFLLATGYAQEGRVDEARDIWLAMQRDLPAESPWQELIVQTLGEEAQASTPAAAPAPGPAAADIKAAAAMGEGDRLEMIETMVAGLDERLRQNPMDGEGWQRLIRSYVVLGRQDEAQSALSRAVEAVGADSALASELTTFAQSLGLDTTGRTN